MIRPPVPGPCLSTLFTSVLLLGFVLAGCGGGGAGPEDPAVATAPEAAAPPTEPLGSSAIAGVVRFEGELPQLRPLDMGADPACAARHSEPVYPQILAVDDQAGLANVLVHVADNVPEGPWPLTAPPVIDQQGCRYTPRVAGIMVGQDLTVLNSDEILHNVHSLSEANRPFNRAMPAAIREATFSFTEAEPAFRIKCDVHPWMSTYLAVFDHPYFAVTGPDGSFEIPGLPAGTYTIEAWHERLGAQRSGVTLLDGQTAAVDLSFSLPDRQR